MVSEEKVILMTKLATFEKEESRKNMNIVNYFRSDYIGFQVLKAIVAATISFVAIFCVYIFYNFESLMEDIYNLDLLEEGKSIIIIYLCAVGAYAIIAYIVYAHRYSKAKRKLKDYYVNLRKLENLNNNR